jgi:peptidylprolyl isomerase
VPSKPGPNKQAARQRVARQQEAAATAQHRRRARQRVIAGVVGVVVVGALILAIIGPGASSNNSAGTSTTTAAQSPTTAAAASVAGKPCVPVADPLPAGAPAVPVKVGPPPAQLVTEDLKVGTGPVVTASQTLTVNYIGVSCSTGKIFDSSYSSGQPATFPLSGVIPGWQQGIPGMHVGGQRLLGIPPAQAYGAEGSPPDIAPDETLWFVVEVISAK